MSGDQLDLDAIEAQARHWDHLIRDDPDTTLALVAEVRRLRALEAQLTEQRAHGVLVHQYLSEGVAPSHPDYARYRRFITQWEPVE